MGLFANKLRISTEQLERANRGEEVELIPAKEGHTIMLTMDMEYYYIPHN
jgi:hypothetical protein